MGGNISAFSGMNSTGMSMDVLSKDYDEAMVIFEDVLKNATVPEEEIGKQKKKILAAIREEETDVFDNGMIHLRRVLYGRHPYSMRISGEIDSVTPISRGEMLDFYRKRFVPQDSIITVVGDVDIDETVGKLTKKFSSWRGRLTSIKDEKVVPLSMKKEEEISMPKEQALYMLGFQGIKVTDKKRFALEIVSALLSGSDGLLFYAVREEQGLAYTSGAVSIPAVDTGYFLFYVATTEENLKKAEKTVLDVIKQVTSGQITDEEIASSKKRLISQYAYSLQTNSSLAMMMTLDELYGLGFRDYKEYPRRIHAVSKQEIVACASEILDIDKSATVIIHSKK